MAAGTVNLPIEQGSTYRFYMVWEYETTPDSDVYEPYDLTGCTARMQVRISPQSPLLFEVTTEGTDEIVLETGGEQGRIDVHLSDENTALLAIKKYVYDLEVEFPSGDVKRVIEGKITVSLNVTKDEP